MNLSETPRINANMDLAHTNRGRFPIQASKKNVSPKSKNSPAYFGLKPPLEVQIKNRPCAKSTSTWTLNVSDNFIKKCRRSRLPGE